MKSTIIEFIKSHREYSYLLLALFGNAILVLSIIGERSFWLDEAVSWYYASLKYDILINNVKQGDKHPPLYYIFLSWWVKSFGTSEIALRFPSYLFGSITIISAFNISKFFFDNFTTGLTLVQVSLFPFLIYYQQEARMYSMLLMFLMLTLNFLLNLVNNEHRILSAILVTVFSIAAMYTHYYGIFGVISLYTGLILYCIIKKYWQRLILLTFSLVSSFIAFYPWIKTIQDQSQSHAIGGVQEVTYYRLKVFTYQNLSFAHYFGGGSIILNGLIHVVFYLSVAAFIYTNTKLMKILKSNTLSLSRGEGVFLYLETVFFTNVLGPIIVSYTKFPLGYSIYNIRYFIFPLVLFKLIIAYCLSNLIKDLKFNKTDGSRVNISLRKFKIRKKQHLQFLLLITIILIQAGYNISNSPDQPDYRELANFIENESKSYIPILVEPYYDTIVFRYYLNETWQQYIESVFYTNNTISEIVDRLQTEAEIWFTYSSSKLFEPSVYDWFLINGLVDQNYGRIEFGRVVLFKIISKTSIQDVYGV